MWQPTGGHFDRRHATHAVLPSLPSVTLGTRAIRRRAVWLLAACVVAGAALSACGGDAERAPSATPTPRASPTTTATASPTPTTPAVATATAAPATQTAARSTPEPTPTPPPTAEDRAIESLSQILPWYGQREGSVGNAAFSILVFVWLRDAELGQLLAGLPWVKDGITQKEVVTLEAFGDMSDLDPGFLRRLASSAWLRDGVAADEFRFLLFVMSVAGSQLAVANTLGDFPALIADSPPTLRSYALSSIEGIGNDDHLLSLAGASWYTDGLSPTEVAFIATLRTISSLYPDQFQPLLDGFYSQSTTTTLPLAGDVTIWVFQNTPFPTGEPLLDTIATTTQLGESFLQLPFPTDHIILLVTDPSEPGFQTGGWHFGTHMLLPRREGTVPNIAHETAHYYFHGGPFWLQEGAANFLEYHVVALEDPVARRATVELEADRCLEYAGLENLRHYLLRQREWISMTSTCAYFLGERFLFRVADVMGTRALGAALGDLFPTRRVPHLQEGDEEEDVFRTLAEHVPEGREAAFTAVYREIHGGFDGFQEPADLDDHGNKRTSSTPLAVNARAEGVLDYAFDDDYFSIFLDHERKYEVIFEHSVSTSSVAMFAVGGRRIVQFESGARLTDRLVVPPASASYYFAVQNFGGEAAPYSLLVRELPSVEDDHGDSLASATAIVVGEKTEGVLHDGTDFDYFRFSVQDRREYCIEIIPPVGSVIRSWLYSEDGLTPGGWFGNDFTAAEEGYGDSFDLQAEEDGSYYVVVNGAQESNLPYSVTIAPIEGGAGC